MATDWIHALKQKRGSGWALALPVEKQQEEDSDEDGERLDAFHADWAEMITWCWAEMASERLVRPLLERRETRAQTGNI